MQSIRTPFIVTRKYFQKRESAVACPIDLVPHNMLDIRSKEIGDGRLYSLSFRKLCLPQLRRPSELFTLNSHPSDPVEFLTKQSYSFGAMATLFQFEGC
jgi:hypothetical protein